MVRPGQAWRARGAGDFSTREEIKNRWIPVSETLKTRAGEGLTPDVHRDSNRAFRRMYFLRNARFGKKTCIGKQIIDKLYLPFPRSPAICHRAIVAGTM